MQLASKFTWKFSRCKNKLRYRQGYILFKKFDFGPKNKKNEFSKHRKNANQKFNFILKNIRYYSFEKILKNLKNNNFDWWIFTVQDTFD